MSHLILPRRLREGRELIGPRKQRGFIVNPYAFGSGPPPVDPIYSYTAATNMAVYDPSDLATLFQDSAGTTPVTADGDPVGLILDQAGNSARDMMQATGGSRLIYRTSGGKHWLENDGAKWMYSRGNGALAFSVVNVFAGARKETGFANYGPIIGHPHAATHTNPFWRWTLQGMSTGGVTVAAVFQSGSNRTDVNAAGAATGSDFLFTYGANNMWSSVSSNQRSNVFRINKAQFSAPSTPDTTTYTNSNVSTLMSHATGVVPWKGNFYGAVVYGVAVTSQAWIDATEAWVNARLQVPV